MRLIEHPAARAALLAAIAAMPVGAKLSIPRLRDALVDQGDVIAAIQAMIGGGQLDPATLRPPVNKKPSKPKRNYAETKAALKAAAERPTGVELHARMTAIGARLRLAPTTISREAFGNQNQLSSMAKGMVRPVHHLTLKKAEAWIAEAANREPAPPPKPSTLPPIVTTFPKPVELPPPVVTARRLAPKVDPKVTGDPKPTFLKPAEVAWCGQCDQRVSGAKATKCTSQWCSLKGKADD